MAETRIGLTLEVGEVADMLSTSRPQRRFAPDTVTLTYRLDPAAGEHGEWLTYGVLATGHVRSAHGGLGIAQGSAGWWEDDWAPGVAPAWLTGVVERLRPGVRAGGVSSDGA